MTLCSRKSEARVNMPASQTSESGAYSAQDRQDRPAELGNNMLRANRGSSRFKDSDITVNMAVKGKDGNGLGLFVPQTGRGDDISAEAGSPKDRHRCQKQPKGRESRRDAFLPVCVLHQVTEMPDAAWRGRRGVGIHAVILPCSGYPASWIYYADRADCRSALARYWS